MKPVTYSLMGNPYWVRELSEFGSSDFYNSKKTIFRRDHEAGSSRRPGGLVGLPDSAQQLANQVLAEETALLRLIETWPLTAAGMIKCRIHGDYHLAQVLLQRLRLVLRQYENAAQSGMKAVAKREVDDTISSPEGHGRLCPLGSQWVQA